MAKGIGLHSVKYYRKAEHKLEEACEIVSKEFPVDYVACIQTLKEELRKMIEG